MNMANHPCFNQQAHRRFGRVHLPVAPRCNLQCNFCNRKFDCVNESRPGVTSGVLTPWQAMVYMETVMRQRPNISVVGIAGPGDPFANPEQTMETLRRVRKTYPDMLLCVATNGLAVGPFVDELADLNVSHVTITLNAVDPHIASGIYAWVRCGKRVYRARQGCGILLENQLEAIRALKARGLVVKINTIIIPGVNDDHVEAVAQTVHDLGADIMNCVPYYPNEGSNFAHLQEPAPLLVKQIRERAEGWLPQMKHCRRCRADAVGILGEKPDIELMERLQACERLPEPSTVTVATEGRRPCVAVASLEGLLVNQHLGEAIRLQIYERSGTGQVTRLEDRQAPEPGSGDQRWMILAERLADCRALLVSGIGKRPEQILSASGLQIHVIEGLIDDAVTAVLADESIAHMAIRSAPCGVGCSGDMTGCG